MRLHHPAGGRPSGRHRAAQEGWRLCSTRYRITSIRLLADSQDTAELEAGWAGPGWWGCRQWRWQMCTKLDEVAGPEVADQCLELQGMLTLIEG